MQHCKIAGGQFSNFGRQISKDIFAVTCIARQDTVLQIP